MSNPIDKLDETVPAQVAETIDTYFKALSERNWDRWSALFDSEAVVHDPADSPGIEGELGPESAWKMLTSPFEKLRIKPQSVFVCGSSVAAKWQAKAAGVGGGSAKFEGITVFELNEASRIQTVISYWDPTQAVLAIAD